MTSTLFILSYEIRNKDHKHRNRSYITDKRPHYTENLSIPVDCSAIGEFVEHIRLLHLPAHEDYNHETADGHKEVGRKLVEEVEEGVSKDLHM